MTEEQNVAVGERGSELASWVMTRVTKWRTERDQRHRSKWDEYARIWRGEWSGSDADKKATRSKIVTPATMQAVDSTCAEIEEAIFGREQWFDVDENLLEAEDVQQRLEMTKARDLLRELLNEEHVPSAVSTAILQAAVYGTGILKVNVYPKIIRGIGSGPDGVQKVLRSEEARVEAISVEPYAFVPDPTTEDLERMLGMAHETIVPYHEVKEGMADGRYRETEISRWSPGENDPGAQNGKLYTVEGASANVDGVKFTEWHGKVPGKYLAKYLADGDAEIDAMADDVDEDDVLIEAIVTIANEAKCIAAKANPFLMKDRSFVAFQHDTVPGYFWGRGVVEKAWNPQKSLDATVRARHDALALVSNPMFAGDVTRLPRGMNLKVWPGKFWPTSGSPADVMQAFSLGQINPDLFSNSQDMERMVNTATGAMDQSANYSADMGAQKSAIVQSAFVKRSRRTMQNIERQLLQPLVQKAMWRYVQYSPLFPQDYQFTVKGTLGMMAREIEQQQMIQLLSLVPNESRPFMAMVKGVFDNTSGPHKAEVIKAIDEMVNPKVSPEAEAEQQRQKALSDRAQEAEVAEKEAKATKANAEAKRALALAHKAEVEAELAPVETQNAQTKLAIDIREVAAFEEQNEVSKMMTHLRAMDTALKAMTANVKMKELELKGKQLEHDAATEE
jgi:hypothetical protein